ncbi:MAG: hypothetical protein JWO05_2007 [Gemmatimonadetes bacterium]|nr:hypothetical protein [Gemmatimonadota bacterium]
MSIDDVLLDEGGAVMNVRNATVGAVGDGSTDDSAAFYGLSAGTYVVPAGIYRFASSGTIAEDVILEVKKGGAVPS